MALLAALFWMGAAGVRAQGTPYAGELPANVEISRGEVCAECAPDELAVRVWGDAEGARSFQSHPPCARAPRRVLAGAADAGALPEPAFALRVPTDARPQALRDLLAALDADPQHLIASLIDGFTSECVVLGVRIAPGWEVRGYRLAIASPVRDESVCRPDGHCATSSADFTATPTELELAGERWLVAVFRNSANPNGFDGDTRTAFLTAYLAPAPGGAER